MCKLFYVYVNWVVFYFRRLIDVIDIVIKELILVLENIVFWNSFLLINKIFLGIIVVFLVLGFFKWYKSSIILIIGGYFFIVMVWNVIF